MAVPFLSDIDFNNKMTLVWTLKYFYEITARHFRFNNVKSGEKWTSHMMRHM